MSSTATVDWSEDNNPVAVSLPTMVSSSDLFDGELFGDELMDIYNSAVEATANNPDLSSFLDGTDDAKKDDADAMLSSASGDGFGTFRPSTSFNDLTTILNSDGKVIVKPTDVTEDTTKSKKPTKKRSSSGSSNPAAKRKVATNRRAKEEETPEATTSSAPVSAAESVPVMEKSSNPVVNNPVVEESAETKAPEPSDFKAIAQAAVSSLIKSVSTSSSDKSKDQVDVSTTHIKALTSNNWVAACATAAQGVATTAVAASTTAAAAAADKNSAAANNVNNQNRIRRQNLTPDERARQNRDRNREHARNTRLRKKAYVEELKRTLTELVAQRDAAEQEKRQAAQREIEQREVRFRVMEEFLKLRGRNEINQGRWSAILEEGFTLTLPSTDFRKMAKGAMKLGEESTLTGVSEVMTEAAAFSAFLQSAGDGEKTVTCQFCCDRKKFYMDGCQAILEWEATTSGIVASGANDEISIRGVVRGNYSPASNKLLSAHITCDVTVLLLKLQKLTSNRPKASATSTAAQAAANQANALIDSIQIPNQVPSAVIVHPSSSSSEASVGEESDAGDGVPASS